MNKLNSKKILLIICGGIAAYKSLEIIRIFKKKGALVKTIMTKSAKKFVTPLSVASLSQEKVYSELFDYNNEAEMDHISLSRWADIILIAPATANTISKLSYGLSDDLASTVVLASNKPIFIAPAMNVRMWEHPANKENLYKLKNFGYQIDPIPGVNLIKVKSAKEMFNETLKNLPADIAIFSAAVADWKVKNIEKNKIKKKDKLNLNLEKNIDILKHISNHNSLRPKIVIGFAAETNNLANNSKKKLLEKNCDWLISNDVSDPKIGFNSDYNEVTIFYKNKNQEKISKIKKSLLADKIVERVISQLN